MDEFKVAIVTGASSGIGAAVVKRLSSMNFKVIMLARDLSRMDLVADQCKAKFKPVPIVIDLKNSGSVNNAFANIKKDFGHIDVFCAVAGIFLNESPISKQLDFEWNDVIETNLTGVMRCLRSSWPLFSRGSSIVTVGSVLGHMSQPEVGASALSKAGVDYVDWYKSDSQGTDMSIFDSLPKNISNKILAAEFEPGIIDAYQGED